MKKIILLLGVVFSLAFGATIDEANKSYDEQKYDVAFPIYEEFAISGNAEAQNNLGLMYAQAKGVEKDYKKAFSWFEKSANQGYAKAQTNLGIMYYYGNGVKQDYKKAIEWYEKACESGNKKACEELKELKNNNFSR